MTERTMHAPVSSFTNVVWARQMLSPIIHSRMMNPLLMTGLVPTDWPDIPFIPPKNSAVT